MVGGLQARRASRLLGKARARAGGARVNKARASKGEGSKGE